MWMICTVFYSCANANDKTLSIAHTNVKQSYCWLIYCWYVIFNYSVFVSVVRSIYFHLPVFIGVCRCSIHYYYIVPLMIHMSIQNNLWIAVSATVSALKVDWSTSICVAYWIVHQQYSQFVVFVLCLKFFSFLLISDCVNYYSKFIMIFKYNLIVGCTKHGSLNAYLTVLKTLKVPVFCLNQISC